VKEISIIEEVTTQYKGSSFPFSNLSYSIAFTFQVLYFLHLFSAMSSFLLLFSMAN